MRKSRVIGLALLGCSTFALASEAHAQMKRPTPDDNGIDVISGLPIVPSGKLTIGQPSQGGLEFYRIWEGGSWFHNLQGTVTVSGTTYTVTVGASVETFTLSGGVYQSDDQIGSTLTKAANGTWTYTLSDGTVIIFENPGTLGSVAIKGLLQKITKPNGLVITFTNKYQQFCEMVGTHCSTGLETDARVQSVTTNTGYQMHLDYARPSSSTPERLSFLDAWLQLVKVTGINEGVDYCDPSADTCTSLTQAWPVANLAKTVNGPFDYTDTWADALSNTTTGTVTNSQLNSVQSPADPGLDFSIAYTSGKVSQFTRGGGTWNYTYADVGTQRTTTVTQPGGGSKVYVSDTSSRKLISVTDELGHTTSYAYDSFIRPTRVTQPEGNYTELTYDTRGNITQRKSVAKSGSGLADIVSTASFDATCTNPKTCNEPNTTTDAKGNTTDYTYDPNHGGVLTVTQPAPTTGAVRPQVRYAYATNQAYYKNTSGGSPVASGQPIYLLTSASACQTLASCAGAADEVKATVDYGPQVAGTANNLLPISISKGSGDGALTATATNAYDMFGNVTSIDGPLSGTADTTGFRYDANRELTMIVSPDPDGAGTLKNRAQQITYNADGNATRIEAGTATSLTGPFTPVGSGERIELTYDSLGRKVTQSLVSGTIASPVVQTLSQYSYDTKGRLNCTAVRMNPATFGSLPTDACTLGTAGSFGPDRITKSIFDNADEVTQAQVAVGTTDAANERTLTYTSNGKLQTLTDAENNKTTYVYDGFDRLSQTQYPNPTKGSGTSNPADYEQLGYDPNSNITSLRLRDGTSISFTFDALNRATFKDLPGTEPDVTYSYDNLGRMTSAAQSGTPLSFTWDALGRNLTQVGPQGTVTSAWDLAGRRTQLTYPGTGLFVNYDYLVTGEVQKVRENGASSGVGVLATYAYDDEGRNTNVTFGNGAVQAFTHDPASRLASLTNDLANTANDLSATFAYNPGSQITSTTRTGDPYAFNGFANENSNGIATGLNQLTSYGAKSLTHDARGNVTAFGTKTFTYSSENLLLTGPNSSTLTYDPVMRLQQLGAASITRFAYDGLDRIGEYDASNNLLRRYVFDGSGQPIVWYEGSGTTDRRFLSSDERGSIISVTDTSGTLLAINRYDEYGRPAAANLGVWGYTGQAWMSDLGEYYYKARVYDPELGRFLQTDPIGYADSPNLYAYVLNDPVNFDDPLGLSTCQSSTEEHIFVCGTSLADIVRGGLPSASVGGVNAPGGTGDDIFVIGRRLKQILQAEQSGSCNTLRIEAGELAERAEDISQGLSLLAVGGAGIAFLSGLNEIDTLGADTPVTAAGTFTAVWAGNASTAFGGIAAGLKSYSAGNLNAAYSFGFELLEERAAGRIISLNRLAKYLPKRARTLLESAAGIILEASAVSTRNRCAGTRSGAR